MTKEFQISYFNYFFDKVGNSQFYKRDKYLWGYGRILVWYSEFQYLETELSYLTHFQAIINYLIELQESQPSIQYLRNAFLCLIYLLTYRDINENFCVPTSKEYQTSEKVVSLYKNYPVYLRRISPDKSLNDYFKDLLYGKSSKRAIKKLLQVD